MPKTTTTETAELTRYLCNDTKNVYIIGHNSGVVSFYSQQCRAFHLALLLKATVKTAGFETLKIGVLGGGIAGVTAWTALRELGFLNCHIFEATDTLLSRQKGSSHRHAHPCINEWPDIGGKRDYSSTTKWPFLNWYGCEAASVGEQLSTDPTFVYQQRSAPDKVHTSYTVKGIKEFHDVVTDSTRVNAAFDTSEGDIKITFDIVVCALGYSYERDLENSASKSYWWSDHIQHYVRDRHEFSKFKRFVSGTGDGGLIDLIRLAEAPGENQSANIAQEIVGYARHEAFRSLDNHWPPDDENESPIEKGLKREIPKGKIDSDTVLSIFSPLFDQMVFRKKFNSDSNLKRIHLVSRNGNYFSDSSSFVNQVLTTFLESRHHELIIHGSVRKNGSVYSKKGGKRVCEQPDEFGNPTKALRIIRHGASPKINEILGEHATINDARNRDSVLHDDSKRLMEMHEKVTPMHDAATADHVLALANSYFDRFFEKSHCQWSQIGDGCEPVLKAKIYHSPENFQAYRKIGGFDRELFNVPLHYEPAGENDFCEETFLDN